MSEDSTERRLIEEPARREQMLDRGDPWHEFTEERKGIDSIPGVPAPLVAQAATDAAASSAAGQSDGAGGETAPVDYDG